MNRHLFSVLCLVSQTFVEIGIFGGSFDPIHTGHLLAVQDAREQLGLDRVVFVPAAVSPFKTKDRPAPGPHRAAMLDAATADLDWAEVNRIELERDGVSYTVDTVRALKANRPKAHWHLLIGMDNLRSFHKWREAKALIDLVSIAVLARPGSRIPKGLNLSARHTEKLLGGILRSRRVDISSTEIRRRVRERKAINNLVPDSVRTYIKEHALYRT